MELALTTARLADVAEIITGSTPSTARPDYYGGDIPFIGPGDLGGSESIVAAQKMLSAKGAEQARMLPSGTVLVCCIGATIGKVGIAGRPLATNQQINAVAFNESVVASRFGYYFCRTLQPVLRQLGASTTLPILSKSRFQELLITFPPLPEQRRIADILDKADAIRRKRKEAIALTEELLRSAFLDMFGDPVTNPKGWEVKALGQLLGFLTSGSRGWAEYYSDAGDTFLRIQNVKQDRLDLTDVAFVNAPDSAEARRTRTKPGDVLLSITADLGRTAVIPESLERAFINQHLAILRPKNVASEYLSAFLASEGGQRQVRRLNKGGVKAGLNFDDIRSVNVLLPPASLQRAFADVKVRIRNLEARYSGAVADDGLLFSALVQRAFTGSLSS